MMAIEKEFFRQVMGHFTTGVTVATTTSQGKPSGLTVSSFSSLSLSPPLVLICVDRTSHTLPLFRGSKIFAVNFLTTQQVHLSRCFAMPSEERFEYFCSVPYHIAATGAPILDKVLAFIDTRLIAEYPGGDHVIFVGEVEAMGTAGTVVFASKEGRARSTLMDYDEISDGTTPLVYYCGQYRHLAQHYSEPSLDER
jgi:flavin reductase (DIM6/NTAB) family NADH-FMN oxidoreductase RutF